MMLSSEVQAILAHARSTLEQLAAQGPGGNTDTDDEDCHSRRERSRRQRRSRSLESVSVRGGSPPTRSQDTAGVPSRGLSLRPRAEESVSLRPRAEESVSLWPRAEESVSLRPRAEESLSLRPRAQEGGGGSGDQVGPRTELEEHRHLRQEVARLQHRAPVPVELPGRIVKLLPSQRRPAADASGSGGAAVPEDADADKGPGFHGYIQVVGGGACTGSPDLAPLAGAAEPVERVDCDALQLGRDVFFRLHRDCVRFDLDSFELQRGDFVLVLLQYQRSPLAQPRAERVRPLEYGSDAGGCPTLEPRSEQALKLLLETGRGIAIEAAKTPFAGVIDVHFAVATAEKGISVDMAAEEIAERGPTKKIQRMRKKTASAAEMVIEARTAASEGVPKEAAVPADAVDIQEAAAEGASSKERLLPPAVRTEGGAETGLPSELEVVAAQDDNDAEHHAELGKRAARIREASLAFWKLCTMACANRIAQQLEKLCGPSEPKTQNVISNTPDTGDASDAGTLSPEGAFPQRNHLLSLLCLAIDADTRGAHSAATRGDQARLRTVLKTLLASLPELGNQIGTGVATSARGPSEDVHGRNQRPTRVRLELLRTLVVLGNADTDPVALRPLRFVLDFVSKQLPTFIRDLFLPVMQEAQRAYCGTGSSQPTDASAPPALPSPDALARLWRKQQRLLAELLMECMQNSFHSFRPERSYAGAPASGALVDGTFCARASQRLAWFPTCRELLLGSADSGARFAHLQGLRVLVDQVYADCSHYLSVYTSLFREDMFSELCEAVSAFVATNHASSTAIPSARQPKLSFLKCKAFSVSRAGLLATNKGDLLLALHIQPDWPRYNRKADAMLGSCDWHSACLREGVLLALSLGGDFAADRDTFYLLVKAAPLGVVGDSERDSKSGRRSRPKSFIILAAVLPKKERDGTDQDADNGDEPAAGQPGGVMGGEGDDGNGGCGDAEASDDQEAAGFRSPRTGDDALTRILDAVNRPGSCVRAIECPNFYVAAGPILKALLATTEIAFERYMVRGDFGDLQTCPDFYLRTEKVLRRQIPMELLTLVEPGDAATVKQLLNSRRASPEIFNAARPEEGDPDGAAMDARAGSKLDPCGLITLEGFLSTADTLLERLPPATAGRPRLYAEQVHALRAVLSSPVAFVRGAPGSGKSFLAARVLQLLLFLKPGLRILVLTAKNHALDETCLRCMELFGPSHVLRMGSRFQDTRLFEVSLKKLLESSMSEASAAASGTSEDKRIERLARAAQSKARRSRDALKSALDDLHRVQMLSFEAFLEHFTLTQCACFFLAAKVELGSNRSRTSQWELRLYERASFLEGELYHLCRYVDWNRYMAAHSSDAGPTDVGPCVNDVFLNFERCHWTVRPAKTRVDSLKGGGKGKPAAFAGDKQPTSDYDRLSSKVFGLRGEFFSVFQLLLVRWLPPEQRFSELAQQLRDVFSRAPLELGEMSDAEGEKPDAADGQDGDNAGLAHEDSQDETEQERRGYAGQETVQFSPKEVFYPSGGDSWSSSWPQGSTNTDWEFPAIPYLPEIAEHSQVNLELLARHDLYRLDFTKRCQFVQLLLQKLVLRKRRVVARAEGLAKEAQAAHQREMLARKVRLLKSRSVVLCTLDSAGMQPELLRAFAPGAVVVEEAGEVLESKLVAAVLSNAADTLRHLIQIGDQQQLPPKPQCYTLEKHYGFGVSNMARLARLGCPQATLMCQSRMRPEIADLSRGGLKSDYPTLQDNLAAVENLTPPKCLSCSVFFWDSGATAGNQTAGDGDPDYLYTETKTGTGVSNLEEALRCVLLAKYLVQQGTCRGDVTLLAAYKGQARLIRELLQKHLPPLPQVEETDTRLAVAPPPEVEVKTIDEYQGNQRPIVFVSFCRSNADHIGGFLKGREGRARLIVAKTRARHTLVLLGNRACLEWDFPRSRCKRTGEKRADRANRTCNPVFGPLFTQLDARGCIGPALQLRCVQHKDVMQDYTSAADLLLDPFTCKVKCGKPLSCGHACAATCHAGACWMACRVQLEMECPKVSETGHKPWTVSCYEKQMGFMDSPRWVLRCPAEVEFDCPKCGGKRTRKCGTPEKFLWCSLKVDFKCSVCSGDLQRACSLPEHKVQCHHMQETRCKRGEHTIKTQCGKEVDQKKVERCCELFAHTLSCGHKLRLPCHEEPPLVEECREIVPYKCADCGDTSEGRWCSETSEQRRQRRECRARVEFRCPEEDCGAVRSRPCFNLRRHEDVLESEVRARQVEPCRKEITSRCPRGHPVTRRCGEKSYQCPTLVRHRCKDCGRSTNAQCSSVSRLQCQTKVKVTCRKCRNPDLWRACSLPASEYRCTSGCRRAWCPQGHRSEHPCHVPCERWTTPEEAALRCQQCARLRYARWQEDAPSHRSAAEHARRAGALLELDLFQVEHTQATISPQFSDGYGLLADVRDRRWCASADPLSMDTFERHFKALEVFVLVEEESAGAADPKVLHSSLDDPKLGFLDAYDALRAGTSGGPQSSRLRVRYLSLDNRRLWVLRQCAPGGMLRVRVSHDCEDLRRKWKPDERRQRGLRHPHDVLIGTSSRLKREAPTDRLRDLQDSDAKRPRVVLLGR